MTDALLQSLLAEPAAANAPRRVVRDWYLLAIILVSVAVEGAVRADVNWRPVGIVVVAALAFTTLWRRTHPLAMMAIAFGVTIGLDQIAYAVTGAPVEYYSSAFLLVMVYALFRWGSGRHAAWGLAVMAGVFGSSLAMSWTGIGDAIGGAIVFVFPAVLGAEVRHLGDRRERQRDEVKTRERELLARELHDTVAHHVSAIAIQAQAGRIVGPDRPQAALDALEAIEREASRTLTEMRGIVASLRGTTDAEYAPQPGFDDIERLARADSGELLIVDVAIAAELVVSVSPVIGAAAYRITQEALTNARRHARGATRVGVSIDTVGGDVRIRIDDDGQTNGHPRGTEGFGLIGMTERAHLLGGELTAGPRTPRGWAVTATIPMEIQS